MREAARLVGVPESTYREWEYGRQIRGEPYVRIAKAFSVSLDELFGHETTTTSLAEDLERLEAFVRAIKAKTHQS